MASIQPITLRISNPLPNGLVSVDISYVVSASSHDLASEQNYREVCVLIGDDTPGDGTDDVIRSVVDQTLVFSSTFPHQSRAIQFFMPASQLNEDATAGPFLDLDADEIRARVTLTPIATSRESNQVVRNQPVFEQAKTAARA
jgi:hypothetical protein